MTIECANDTAGHGTGKAERISDGEHEIAHLYPVTVDECDARQLFATRIDAKDRKIRSRIRKQDACLELSLVGQRHHDVLPPLDHMPIG